MDDKENLESDSKYLDVASIIRDQNTFYCISEYILSILESNPYAINRFIESIRSSKCSISNTKYEKRIEDVIDILNEQRGCSKFIAEDGDYEKAWDLLDEEVKKAIILLCNGVKQ